MLARAWQRLWIVKVSLTAVQRDEKERQINLSVFTEVFTEIQSKKNMLPFVKAVYSLRRGKKTGCFIT